MKYIKTVKMKLSNILLDDELIENRHINQHTVKRYRSAMHFDGVQDFPLIVLNIDTKTIVSGNHRYTAMLQEYGKELEVEVKLNKYKNRREQIEHAVTENMKFGKMLDGFEAKRFRKWLYELNSPVERIAQLFNQTENAIKKELGTLKIVRVGKRRKTKTILEQKNGKDVTERREPVKRSIPNSVEEMTLTQWEEHKEKDIGVTVPLLAKQIIRHIKNDFIDLSYVSVLEELYDVLGVYLASLEKKVSK